MTPGKKRDGFIVCDNLLPHKARILLMLALTVYQGPQGYPEDVLRVLEPKKDCSFLIRRSQFCFFSTWAWVNIG